MEKKYNIDDIENFLNKEMDAADLAAFEKEMEADKDLAGEIDFHADVIKGIEGAAPLDFRKMVGNVHEEMKTEGFFSDTQIDEVVEINTQQEATVRNISLFRRLAIAASFALLLTVGWFLLNQQPNTPEQLFADNFTIHQDVLSVEIEDRLAETGFGTNKEALTNLQKGMDDYTAGDYQSAINQFSLFQSTAAEDALVDYASFYKAISLLEIGKSAEAQSTLEVTVKRAAFPLMDDAKWYLALAYLQQNEIAPAYSLLKELKQTTVYKERATDLLNNYQK